MKKSISIVMCFVLTLLSSFAIIVSADVTALTPQTTTKIEFADAQAELASSNASGLYNVAPKMSAENQGGIFYGSKLSPISGDPNCEACIMDNATLAKLTYTLPVALPVEEIYYGVGSNSRGTASKIEDNQFQKVIAINEQKQEFVIFKTADEPLDENGDEAGGVHGLYKIPVSGDIGKIKAIRLEQWTNEEVAAAGKTRAGTAVAYRGLFVMSREALLTWDEAKSLLENEDKTNVSDRLSFNSGGVQYMSAANATDGDLSTSILMDNGLAQSEDVKYNWHLSKSVFASDFLFCTDTGVRPYGSSFLEIRVTDVFGKTYVIGKIGDCNVEGNHTRRFSIPKNAGSITDVTVCKISRDKIVSGYPYFSDAATVGGALSFKEMALYADLNDQPSEMKIKNLTVGGDGYFVPGYSPENAVDGDIGTVFITYSHRAASENRSLILDLGIRANIKDVIITPRSGFYPRSAYLEVRGTNDPSVNFDDMTMLGRISKDGCTSSWSLSNAVTDTATKEANNLTGDDCYRYVAIGRPSDGEWTSADVELAEVKVYASPKGIMSEIDIKNLSIGGDGYYFERGSSLTYFSDKAIDGNASTFFYTFSSKDRDTNRTLIVDLNYMVNVKDVIITPRQGNFQSNSAYLEVRGTNDLSVNFDDMTMLGRISKNGCTSPWSLAKAVTDTETKEINNLTGNDRYRYIVIGRQSDGEWSTSDLAVAEVKVYTDAPEVFSAWDISETSASETGKTYTASINVLNQSFTDDQSYVLILASYNDDGSLDDVVCENCAVLSADRKTLSAKITVPSNVCRIKAMLLRNVNNIMPAVISGELNLTGN